MFKTVVLLFHTYKLARNPENTGAAFAVIDTLIEKASPEQLDFFESVLLADAGFRSLQESGDQILVKGTYDIDALDSLPSGTLGNTYAAHMKERGLNPDFYTEMPGRSVLQFARNRLAKTHDVWHVVVGFNTTVPGELGLQAFYAAQMSSVAFFAIILAGGLHALYREDNKLAMEILEEISFGYRAGKRAQKLFGICWENYWAEDIGVIRKRFDIEAGYRSYPP